MNEQNLNKIFKAVRAELPPTPPGDFEAQVMRQIHQAPKREATSLFDPLALLFPKLAGAAIVVIVLCVVGDFVVGALNLPDLAEGATQISNQWLLTETGI